MPALRRFETRVKAGYVIVTLLLATGMAVFVHRLATMADAQVASLRLAENEIPLIERMRWHTELIVSSGRGYFLTGNPALLDKVRESTAQFDASLHALLSAHEPGLDSQPLADEVRDAVREFLRVQSALLAGPPSADLRLEERFEAELLPLRRHLDQALAKLIEHKQVALERTYQQARAARHRMARWLYLMLGVLVLIDLWVAWGFARLLARAYHHERESLAAARRALDARDEIMGIVAHDLRNPLSAITMKAALLRRRADNEKTREQARSIEDITLRMEHLIRSMLDVSTIEAGTFSVAPTPCEVDDLLCETAAMLTPIAAAREVRFEQRALRPGLRVLADRDRVIQVLSNIIGNALKFTPAGGEVTVTVEPRPAEALFSVRDTGPGIPREHLERIFDRFWKDETPGKKGTGLGLFIARGIVNAHGGRIWVVSEPGSGACFHFTLPLATEAQPRRSAPP